MKNGKIRVLSLLLAIMMVAGVFTSCKAPAETTGGETTDAIETTASSTETDESNGSDATTDIPQDDDSDTGSSKEDDSATEESDEESDGDSESDASSDTESTVTELGSGTEGETESETDSQIEIATDEPPLPSLIEGENAALIEYADRIANGVNAYYTDTKRTGYHFYNRNTSVTCDLQNTKVVTAISNKAGQNYIENTMDVFIRMKDGSEYYASDSTNNAIANIFRLGYYYYENRIEGQTFLDPYTFEDPEGKSINHTSINRYNMCNGIKENGVLKLTVTNNQDPWISFGSINYRASDYNVLKLTMKVDTQFSTGFSIFMNAGSRSGVDSTSFSNEQSLGFDIVADGEYHTYYIPIYYIADYTGKVTGLRFDFMPAQGAIDAEIEISDLRLLNATINDGPTEVYLNRMFNTYSDKLHQTIQITALREIEDVLAVGIVTEIPEEKVDKIVIKDRGGLHYSLEDKIAWNHVNYVGFDVKGVGIIGFILPYDGSGGKITVNLENGVYKIEQIMVPTDYTLTPSESGTRNGSDLYFGHRIYTDTYHTFDRFIAEAELEINPLTEENFVIDPDASTFGQFVGYDGLRGCYTINMDGEAGFGPAYKLHQNRQYNVTFNLKGDGVNDRRLYVLAQVLGGGALECAALLDGKQMMLPVPIEVGKNFGEGGDSPIFCMDDARYSETILPFVASANTDSTYSIVNLYYNWGKYPLKQISFIQYYSPYYHLSTGVHESNCIIPYYFTQWADTLNMLPDHRPMSGPVWDGDPQRTYCGVHSFLQYTDADGNYYASENVKDVIGSYGPIYADVTMDFISDDGKIKISYNHMEFPQTDENRAFYEMKYEILEDVSFKNFAKDFSFYSVTSLDPTGLYTKVGYLDKNNESKVATAAVKGESFSYVLGDNCPYFSFFDMPDCGDKERGYNNLSFLIYKSDFKIGGETATPNFVVNNDFAKLSLSLDLGEVTLKAGDSFTIYAIIMPWQYYDVYDEIEPDKNVRRVRENTLLNPLTVAADKDCEVIESVFLPKVRSTNGKSAEFTLSGGHNNVAVRVYGFDKLTAPVIEEFVDGEWQIVDISSFSTPDPFGYGYYYDGYGVYYDGDGTYSYAFVTTMTDGAPRRFRVTAAEDFAGWPEIPEVEDPMNFWLDPQDLNAKFTTAAPRFGEFGIMSEDGINFIRVNRNGTASEATLPLFEDENGALAGRYLVFKYRAPQGTASKIETLQFYTSTENVMYDEDGSILIVGQDFNAHSPSISDGNWHVIIFDLEAYADRDCFKKADDGSYYVKYLRYDTFNPEYATNAIIDIAYIGFHDSLEYILDYNENDLDYVSVFTGRTDYKNLDTKTGEEVDVAPPVAPPVNAPTDDPDAPAFNLMMNAETLNTKIAPFTSRFHSVTLSADKAYITLAGATGNEATVEFFKDSEVETGRYLVLKYRIPKADQAPFGYWQFYLNTDGASAGSGNAYSSEGHGTAVISDGEWQVLIVDIAARMNPTYVRNSDGKYLAKFFRFDFFNSKFSADVTYDIEYIAFSDNLSALLAEESDMEYVTYFTAQTEYKMLDPKTGNEIGGSGDDTPEETTNPGGNATESDGFNYMLDAEALDAKIAPSKAKFHSVTLSEGKDYITLAGSVGAEVAIEFVKGSKITAGRYLVIKYRIPKADQAPFGYWQFYLNTDGAAAGSENAYSCEGHGTMVISDGEWQVLIVDLEARNNATYAKNTEGKYVAQFFRFDFFNSQFGADVTYDLEYIAFSDSLDGILEYESDLNYVTLCTAQKESTRLDPKTGDEITAK